MIVSITLGLYFGCAVNTVASMIAFIASGRASAFCCRYAFSTTRVMPTVGDLGVAGSERGDLDGIAAHPNHFRFYSVLAEQVFSLRDPKRNRGGAHAAVGDDDLSRGGERKAVDCDPEKQN